jgi:ATP-dependent DNA helicase RecG
VPIQISVYPDQMYIFNIGELPRALPPEQLFVKHSSMPRNPNIANAFFKTGMVEGWGRGYEKIIDSCKEYGDLLPEVKAQQGGVMVHIVENDRHRELRLGYDGGDLGAAYLSSLSVQPEKTGERINEQIKNKKIIQDSIGSQYGRLLTFLLYQPDATLPDIVKSINLSESTVRRRLGELREKGLLDREGSRKTGNWVIIDE